MHELARVAQAEELSPEAMDRRLRGLKILEEMGVDAKVAGIVLVCPDEAHSNESGTLADMVGLENARLTNTVTEIVKEAQSEGYDPSREVERVMKHFAQKDEQGNVVREIMPELQKKN